MTISLKLEAFFKKTKLQITSIPSKFAKDKVSEHLEWLLPQETKWPGQKRNLFKDNKKESRTTSKYASFLSAFSHNQNEYEESKATGPRSLYLIWIMKDSD